MLNTEATTKSKGIYTHKIYTQASNSQCFFMLLPAVWLCILPQGSCVLEVVFAYDPVVSEGCSAPE